jgi:hypothetical protein
MEKTSFSEESDILILRVDRRCREAILVRLCPGYRSIGPQ